MNSKTVFALATPTGGAIAIIRISGSNTLSVLKGAYNGRIAHSVLTHGRIMRGSEVLDDVMAVYFAAPNSYTGEDMAELFIHGGAQVAQAVCELLLSLGAIPAQAGEFTRRAFINGKTDMASAEAVIDIITAQSRRGAASAALQLSGALKNELESVESGLTDICAQLSVAVDYPDETDEADYIELRRKTESCLSHISRLSQHGKQGRYIREGIRIALTGLPNCGKSSLLNCILKEDKAIVTAVPGTTRDIIEAATQMDGIAVTLFDTAGLRETNDEIEAVGVARARALLKNADLLFVLIDCSKPLTADEAALLDETANFERIVVFTKSDIATNGFKAACKGIFVSSVTGAGVDELKATAARCFCPCDEAGLITNTRHIAALDGACRCLSSALSLSFEAETDIAADEVGLALSEIGKITGKCASESVIERIFSRFCVGK